MLDNNTTLRKRPASHFCFSRYKALNINGDILFESPIINKDIGKLLEIYDPIPNPSVLFKREVFTSVGESRPLSTGEDYDFWLRVIEKGYKIGFINECLLNYTINESGLSHSSLLATYYATKMLLKMHKDRINNRKERISVECFNKKIKKLKSKKYMNKRLSNVEKLFEKMRGKKYFMPIYLGVAFLISPRFTLNKVIISCKKALIPTI